MGIARQFIAPGHPVMNSLCWKWCSKIWNVECTSDSNIYWYRKNTTEGIVVLLCRTIANVKSPRKLIYTWTVKCTYGLTEFLPRIPRKKKEVVLPMCLFHVTYQFWWEESADKNPRCMDYGCCFTKTRHITLYYGPVCVRPSIEWTC